VTNGWAFTQVRALIKNETGLTPFGRLIGEYIKEGEEIYLDYGPDFPYDWKGGREGRHARKNKGE
jgi:hypothetical protein